MVLSDLCIGYPQVALASGINAELRPGSFVCLTGRNGSGKSTLLRTLAALQPAMSGNITIQGKVLTDYTHTELARVMSLVLTQMPELPNTTLRELVAYGRLPYSSWLGKFSSDDLKAADNAIAQMHIEHLSHKLIGELSDGERQKTQIARALAQGTRYMLFDEPSAFLDYESRVELMEMLQNLAHSQGKAILLSTHDREMAQRYADQIWRICDAQLIIEN